MMKKVLLVLALLLPAFAQAQIVTVPLPVTLTNGTLADANQVMSDFNAIVTGVNTNGAKNGANSDITSLSVLSTPITPAQGGSSVYTGNDTGSANAYVVATMTPINFTLRSGNTINFIPSASNTGPSTLVGAGTTATAILRQTATGLQPLAGGEIITGQSAQVIYDGVQYELLNSVVSASVQPCTEIDYRGITTPSGYLFEDGTTRLRASFPALFACLAASGVAATLNGTTTVTVANGLLYQVGWFVGGSNITCNSVIQSVGSTTIVLNNAAGASGASTLTIGPYQQGDCSTTFNLPNAQGRASVGIDTSGAVLTSTTCTNPASIGTNCGSQTQTLTLAQLPTGITVTGSISVASGNPSFPNIAVSSGAIGGAVITQSGAVAIPFSNAGLWTGTTAMNGTANLTSNNTSGAALPIVQPIGLVTKAIKF
jgi:microcystin-dependent protein